VKGRGLFNQRLRDDLGTALLALVLSLVVWVNATYQSDKPHEDVFPQPIPIEVLNPPSGLTVTKNSDETVRVSIKAFNSSWSSLAASSFRATVDWKGLAEGVHRVPIKVTCSDRSVTIVSTQPESVYVQFERLVKEAVEVKVDIQDKDALPLGYAIEPPEVDPRFVSVEGAASVVERVKALVVSVSLMGQRTAVERVVEPRPVDENGKAVNNVKLSPQTVKVKFDIQKKLNYREVAVRARTRGNPARGYFVSSVNVEPATVTVFGPPAAVAAMPGLVSVKGEVDVTGATRMFAQRMDLALPEGVSVFSEQQGDPQQVLVTVEIDAVKGGTTVELPLQVRKLQDGLVAKLSVPAVDVILTGPAVLLDDLNVNLLEAYVDLGGLGVGTHQVRTVVDILVSKNPKLVDLVVTSISPEYVEADIRETPPPTATPTLSPTSLTVTPEVEATMTITATMTLSPTVTGKRTVTPGPSKTPTPR
jgi:YbbR domain-containing protein